jgi:hypothetical protein
MPSLLPDDSPAACLGCQYSLRGLTVNRCPECGREFDPNDPKTMWMGPSQTHGVRSNWDRAGLVLHSTVLGIALLLLVVNGFAGDCFPINPLGDCFLIFISAALLLRRALGYGPLTCYPDSQRGRHGAWRRWLTIPRILFFTLVLVMANVPLRITFWLSRPAMDRVAEAFMQMPVGTYDNTHRYIGFYSTSYVARFEEGVSFEFGPGGFCSSWGYEYSPDGPPSRRGPVRQSYFGGGWYLHVSSD